MEEDNSTELVGGGEKREIRIVDYNSQWKERFQELASTIAASLGESVARIEHIGSTSVEGLAAKPIIDILLVVKDSGNESSYLPQLQAAGYELRVREPGWYEHRMFRSPARDVHIHVYSQGCSEVGRSLRLRDRLRQSASDRVVYERTKRRRAALDWPNMNAYADAKSQVIARIIANSELAEDLR